MVYRKGVHLRKVRTLYLRVLERHKWMAFERTQAFNGMQMSEFLTEIYRCRHFDGAFTGCTQLYLATSEVEGLANCKSLTTCSPTLLFITLFPKILYGQSMGAAFATDLAKRRADKVKYNERLLFVDF